MGLPKTELSKDFNFNTDKANPVNVETKTYNDIGYGYKNKKFDYLTDYYQLEILRLHYEEKKSELNSYFNNKVETENGRNDASSSLRFLFGTHLIFF